jgi:hypothetical protein
LIGETLDDPVPAVRIKAAGAMLENDHAPSLTELTRQLESANLNDALMAARELQMVGDSARPAVPAMRRALENASAHEGQDPLYMFIRFSLTRALEDLDRDQ